MLTVVPSSRFNANVLPAGTVNELIFTVVHWTALVTSSKDEIVPTQLLLTNGVAAKRVARKNKADEGDMAGHKIDLV